MAVVGRVLSMGSNTTPVQQPLLNLPMAQAQSWEGTFPQAQQAPYQRQQSQQIHPMYNQQMQRKLNTHPGMVRQASEEDVMTERYAYALFSSASFAHAHHTVAGTTTARRSAP